MITVKYLEDHSAILITADKNLVIPDDFDSFSAEVLSILALENASVTLIYDLRQLDISVDILMKITKDGMNRKDNIGIHPQVKMSILITDNGLLKLSINGFSQLGLGNNLRIVSSLEDALAIVH